LKICLSLSFCLDLQKALQMLLSWHLSSSHEMHSIFEWLTIGLRFYSHAYQYNGLNTFEFKLSVLLLACNMSNCFGCAEMQQPD
jgi:hypothetical protein